MYLILVVSGIFILFGLSFSWIFHYFRNNGETLKATVVGIESYKSRHNNKSTSTMYRPIIKYYFQGSKCLFTASYSSSDIHHTIGDKVKVLSLNKGPEYVKLKTKAQWLFPVTFFLFGLGGSLGFFYLNPNKNVLMIYIIFLLLIPVAFFQILKSKGFLDQFIDSILKTKLEDDESLKERNIFFDKSDLDKKITSFRKSGIIITIIFFFASNVGLYYSWLYSKLSSKEYFMKIIKDYELLNDLKLYIHDKNFFLFLILLFFTIVLAYSLIYQAFIKKDNVPF